MRACRLILLAVLLVFGHFSTAFAADSKPIPIKVVVMAMFERGEPTGDSPGELQLWLERGGITDEHIFPMGEANQNTICRRVISV